MWRGKDLKFCSVWFQVFCIVKLLTSPLLALNAPILPGSLWALGEYICNKQSLQIHVPLMHTFMVGFSFYERKGCDKFQLLFRSNFGEGDSLNICLFIEWNLWNILFSYQWWFFYEVSGFPKELSEFQVPFRLRNDWTYVISCTVCHMDSDKVNKTSVFTCNSTVYNQLQWFRWESNGRNLIANWRPSIAG